MKKGIYPNLYQTIIQMKNGSSYLKKWLFFRKELPLDIDVNSNNLWKKNLIKRKNIKNLTLNTKKW